MAAAGMGMAGRTALHTEEDDRDSLALRRFGSQNDNLTLNATSADAAELADLLIDGGNGQDTCVHTDNVEAVRCEA